IKICASPTCDWIFYDGSRTSRRRWCDMATCGNRAKAARHRARERASGSDGVTVAGESLPA
ncbi:MAG TPA: CGNR zinc finger domain-containing protein, partial [Candidatus Limnocylindrales bacterium]